MAALLQYAGNAFGFLAAVVVVLTAAGLPWMLGGVVPAARLVLLAAAVTAASLSFLAELFRRRLHTTLPAVFIPLVALALLGTFQLRPSEQCLTSTMHHAVSFNSETAIGNGQYSHSLSPADTRSTVATLLALSLIASVAFENIRSSRAIVATSLVFLTNAGLITVIGLSELFGQPGLRLNEKWFLGRSQGLNTFAGFINPNNAAGWLCLGVALAAGWKTWYLKPSATDPKLRVGRLKISFWGRLWQRIVETIADLTVWQTLAFSGITFLVAGVAATKSRGGIVALLAAIILVVAVRSSVRKLPIVLLLLVIAGVTTFGFLRWLSLDTDVVGEIGTLRNLRSASAIRVDHWLDSLNIVRDFPLTGTGLGSYRFATLPYLTQDAGVWFRHADNYYVDMAVEGGLIGLLTFVGVGLCSLFTGFAAWAQGKTRKISRGEDTPKVSRRFLAALGTATVLATLTQACAGFFDYGIGLPAASILLIVIVASTAGFLAENNSIQSLRTSGSVAVGALVAVPIKLCLIVAAGTYLTDQHAATEVDDVVVVGHQILHSPVTAPKLDRISTTRAVLLDELKKRPDDPEGLRLLCRLTEAQLRWQILLSGRGDTVRDDPELEQEWKRTTLSSLLTKLTALEKTDNAQAPALRQELIRRITRLDLAAVLDLTQRTCPLMPKIPFSRAATALLLSDTDAFNSQVSIVRFSEPAGASSLFGFGVLSLQAENTKLAKEFWTASLNLSEEFRVAMLAEGGRHWKAEELLSMFGPQDYVTGVRAAKKAFNSALSTQLWNRAEELWQDAATPTDAETSLLRTEHLLRDGRTEEVFAWLEKATKDHSNDPRLLQHYARLLEQKGDYEGSRERWIRIRFLDPGNAEADKAIARLTGAE